MFVVSSKPRLNALVSISFWNQKQKHLPYRWNERLEILRAYVKEDPTATYDLHSAFSKDPDTVKVEDAWDEYTKIQQAAIRAGKRPPKKKKPQFDATGRRIGIRFFNKDRIRERLVAEGLKMDPQFYIGRYGINKEVVRRIRSAFRFYEIVRLEVGTPWTDNTDKFAERLEYRTGAIVLDRAGKSLRKSVLECQDLGSRFLLYRGFTHADLARKGLIDPSCFTVDNSYVPPPVSKQTQTFIQQMQDAGDRRDKSQLEKLVANEAKKRTSQLSEKDNDLGELLNEEEGLSKFEDDIKLSRHTMIDVDEPEPLLRDISDESDENVEKLAASIQHNAERLKRTIESTPQSRVP